MPQAAETTSTAERIERAALELFSARGYRATSVRDIMDASGLATGALYTHYSSKADLLFTMVRRTHEVLLSRLQQTSAAEFEAPVEHLRAATYTLALFHTEFPREALVANDEYRRLPVEMASEIATVRRAILRHIYEPVLRILRTRGEPEAVEETAKISAMAISNMATRIATWYRRDGALEPDEVARMHAEMAVGLVAAMPPIVPVAK